MEIVKTSLNISGTYISVHLQFKTIKSENQPIYEKKVILEHKKGEVVLVKGSDKNVVCEH